MLNRPHQSHSMETPVIDQGLDILPSNNDLPVYMEQFCDNLRAHIDQSVNDLRVHIEQTFNDLEARIEECFNSSRVYKE